MRDYDDDNIRLYTPVLQRVIILAAVIIAVPVVMWTITSFVRTYVAPPKAPTFQRLTENEPSQSASDAAPAAGAPAAAPQLAPAAPPPAIQPTAAAPVQPMAGPAPAAPPPAIQPTAAASAQPIAAPAPAAPAAPALAAPPLAPPPPSAAMPDAAAKASAGAPASDRGYAWPNPNTNAPPGFGLDNGAAGGRKLAVNEPPAASDAATADLSPGEPIAGPIPLPRRRPNDVAMLQSSLQPGLPGGVPLPRARPADAPAATASPVNDTPAYDYDTGMGQH